MMRSLIKMSVLLLLACVIAAPLVAQSLPSDLDPDQQPAGCHQSTTPVPKPGPTSHSCCQAGHNLAIVQQGSTVRTPLHRLGAADFQPDSILRGLTSSPNLVIVGSNPPITSPLRV